MKKLLLLLSLVLILSSSTSFAVDTTVTALPELTTMTDDDLIMVIDTPGTTPASRKMTGANLKASTSASTDPIYDAAGDLVVGSGANTAGALTKGAEGTVLTAGAATLSWIAPTVYQASNATLTSLAGLTETNGGLPYGTADNAYAWLAAGASGKILIAKGAAAPQWTPYTMPATVPTTGYGLTSDGTNLVATSSAFGTAAYTASTAYQAASATLGSLAGLTETNGGIPYGTADNAYAWLAAGASGKILQGNGAGAPTWSTPTYPSASGTARKVLVSDGTNNVYSTETWAAPGAVGGIFYSDGTNWVRLAAGTDGYYLKAKGALAPEWATVTAAIPTAITVADTTDTTSYVGLFESATGNLGPKTDAGITYNAGTGSLTLTGTVGAAGFTSAKASGVAGDDSRYEATTTDTSASGRRGADSLTYSYRGKDPGTRATSANMVEAWTNVGETGDGLDATPWVQTIGWVDLDNYSPVAGSSSITAIGTLSSGNADAAVTDASTTARGKVELAIGSEVDTGTSTALAVTPDALSGSYAGTKDVGWTIHDSDVATAVADGKKAYAVPSSLNGMNLIDMTCSVSDLNSATGGATTVVLRRVRGVTAANMTSTGVTIDYNAYTASDETVDAANDDLATGDMLFIDIDAVTTGAVQKGLSCTALFRLP